MSVVGINVRVNDGLNGSKVEGVGLDEGVSNELKDELFELWDDVAIWNGEEFALDAFALSKFAAFDLEDFELRNAFALSKCAFP